MRRNLRAVDDRAERLVRAARAGQVLAVRELLDEGVPVDARDSDGRTSLVHAVIGGHEDVMQELISRGADVSTQDEHGWSPLHFAAQERRARIAETLLQNGANVEAQDEHGNTPLWRAVFASRGQADVIVVLRRYGADRERKNQHDVSPRDLARSISNYDLAGLLE